MTTDMSERERMREFVLKSWQRDQWMKKARSTYISGAALRRFIALAREANRQAVRLWYGRTTRS